MSDTAAEAKHRLVNPSKVVTTGCPAGPIAFGSGPMPLDISAKWTNMSAAEAPEGIALAEMDPLDHFVELIDLVDLGSADPTERIRELIRDDPEVGRAWANYEPMATSIPLAVLDPEEIRFIENLKKTGELEQLMAASAMSSSSINAEQIRDAIADMDQYTDGIEKQLAIYQAHIARHNATMQPGATMASQRIAMDEFKKEDLLRQKAKLDEELKIKDELVREHARALEGTLREDQNDTEDWEQFSVSASASASNRSPTTYDTLLNKLQSLGQLLSHDNPGNEAIVKAARHYTNEQVYIVVSQCRAALDLAFAEAARTHDASAAESNGPDEEIRAEIQAVLEEIRSLWDETAPVAHMVAEKELLAPITKRVNRMSAKRDAQQHAAVSYILACLRFMNERLGALSSSLTMAVYHHESLLSAYEFAQRVNSESSAIAKISSSDSMPVVANAHDAERGALNLIKATLEQFGRRLPLSDLSKPPAVLATKLDQMVQERVAKGDEVLQSVHDSYETAVKSGIDDYSFAVRTVLEAVLADSLIDRRARGGALQDGQTEESILALQKECEAVQALIERLGISKIGLTAKSLQPALKRGLKIPDDEHGPGCSKNDTAPCPKCHQALQAASFIRRWGDNAEFKGF